MLGLRLKITGRYLFMETLGWVCFTLTDLWPYVALPIGTQLYCLGCANTGFLLCPIDNALWSTFIILSILKILSKMIAVSLRLKIRNGFDNWLSIFIRRVALLLVEIMQVSEFFVIFSFCCFIFTISLFVLIHFLSWIFP